MDVHGTILMNSLCKKHEFCQINASNGYFSNQESSEFEVFKVLGHKSREEVRTNASFGFRDKEKALSWVEDEFSEIVEPASFQPAYNSMV